MEPVFEYRRSTKDEGREWLVWAVFTTAGLLALIWFLRSIRAESSPKDSTLDVLGVIFTIMLGVGIALYYVSRNIKMDTYFTVQIFEDRIECECPHPDFGPSFTLMLEEISHVERDRDGWCEIVTHKGEVFQVTREYGNPRDQILSTLQSLRPELETKHVEVLSSSRTAKTI